MKKIFLLLILCFGFFFLGGSIMKAETTTSIYHIVTTAGVDASKEITINWHCDDSGSYVLLTESTDTEFLNAKKLKPTMEKYWSTEGIKNANTTDTFYTKRRYVCYLELTDLSPRTKYIYKVCLKNEESSVYHFTTAGLTNEWKFTAFCDYQKKYNSVSHDLIERLNKIAGNPSLVVCSGDLIDTAAFEAEWSWLFDDNKKTFSNFIFMSAPGDHEYWGSDTSPIPMMPEPATYNNILKNPSNGASLSKNSNYYFYYNNVLFVSLDFLDSNTVSNAKIDEEATWFKNTIKSLEGTFQYLVVFGHKSIYGSTIEDSSVAKKIRPQWYPIFDECKVDLVISGHDHMHSRTYQLYNNMVSDDPLVGTYYMDLGSSGNKRRTLDNSTAEDGLHQKVLDIKTLGISLGAVITVNESNMLVECYDQTGVRKDQFSIKAKRSAPELPESDFNQEKFLNDIEITPKSVNEKIATLKLNESSELKYIKMIEVVSKKTILSELISYNKIPEKYDLYDVEGNKLKIRVTLWDKRTIEMEKYVKVDGEIGDFSDDLDKEYKVTVTNKYTSFSNLTYKLYVDGELYQEYEKPPIKEHTFTFGFDQITDNHTYKLEVYNGGELIGEKEGSFEKKCDHFLDLSKYESGGDPIECLNVGDKVLLVGMKYWEVFHEVDDGVIKLTKDNILEITGEGESKFEMTSGCIIFIYGVKVGDTEATSPDSPTEPDTPTEPDKPETPTEPDTPSDPVIEPTPAPEAKKGCASGAIQMIYSIMAVMGLAFLFRRRYL